MAGVVGAGGAGNGATEVAGAGAAVGGGVVLAGTGAGVGVGAGVPGGVGSTWAPALAAASSALRVKA